MNRLVENLLFLARSESGHSRIYPECFSVEELFQELIHEQNVIDTEHSYRVSVPTGAEMVGDRGLLKQMLRVFIDNSVKYTPEGGYIALTYTPTKEGGELMVEDDGLGMEPEETTHVFERFYRVDTSRSRTGGSLGLGLSIAAEICALHGGSIRAESEKNRGTRLIARIPRRELPTKG